MTAIGIPPRPSGEWEWPLADVERNAAVLREAIEHEAELHDDYEVSALAGSLYLVTHPKVPVSTDDDYPEWAAALAARIENEQQQRRQT